MQLITTFLSFFISLQDCIIPPSDNIDAKGRPRAKPALKPGSIPTIFNQPEHRLTAKQLRKLLREGKVETLKQRSKQRPKIKRNPTPVRFQGSSENQEYFSPAAVLEQYMDVPEDINDFNDKNVIEKQPKDRYVQHDDSDANEYSKIMNMYQQKIQRLESDLQDARNELTAVKKLFRPDQMKKLTGKRSRWSNESIDEGLENMSLMGQKAYETMREKGYPWPSVTTLNDNIRGKNVKNETKESESHDLSNVMTASAAVDLLVSAQFNELKSPNYDQ